jgi:nucleoside-diphosphate-sugar epimerase
VPAAISTISILRPLLLTDFQGEIRWDTSKPNGQPRRKLDTSRAEQLFGFKSSTPFEKGLKTTIDWFRSHLGK